MEISVNEGIAFLPNGQTVDLLNVQTQLNGAFQDTGESDYAQAADAMSQITQKFQGPHGVFEPLDPEQSKPPVQGDVLFKSIVECFASAITREVRANLATELSTIRENLSKIDDRLRTAESAPMEVRAAISEVFDQELENALDRGFDLSNYIDWSDRAIKSEITDIVDEELRENSALEEVIENRVRDLLSTARVEISL